MEAILVLVLIFFFPTIVRWLIHVLGAGATAAVTGKSFEEAMGRIPPISVRLTDQTIDGKPGGLPYKAIEVKGLFPIQSSKNIAFVVSLFDKTDGPDHLLPVIGVIDNSQEIETPAFQQRADIGFVQPNQGFIKWIEIGRIAPMFLQAPYSATVELRCAFD